MSQANAETCNKNEVVRNKEFLRECLDLLGDIHAKLVKKVEINPYEIEVSEYEGICEMVEGEKGETETDRQFKLTRLSATLQTACD